MYRTEHSLRDVYELFESMRKTLEFFGVLMPPKLEKLYHAVGNAVILERGIKNLEDARSLLKNNVVLREKSEAAFDELKTFWNGYQANLELPAPEPEE